jgi:uncharacterized damage-inducible protein DinB
LTTTGQRSPTRHHSIPKIEYQQWFGGDFDMDANAFRYLYDYHFAENRKIWDGFITDLSLEQFTQQVDYSRGSVRDQLVHLMETEGVWFTELRGAEFSQTVPPSTSDDRELIRTRWDSVEQEIRDYLARLQDSMLFEKPIKEPEEDRVLTVWQVLLHVVNHGTDHRAQILRSLNDMGVRTPPQDFIFYVYEHL